MIRITLARYPPWGGEGREDRFARLVGFFLFSAKLSKLRGKWIERKEVLGNMPIATTRVNYSDNSGQQSTLKSKSSQVRAHWKSHASRPPSEYTTAHVGNHDQVGRPGTPLRAVNLRLRMMQKGLGETFCELTKGRQR